MKHFSITLFALILFSGSVISQAQTISDFENLALPIDSYYNGSDLSGSFNSGNVYFHCVYDTSYGGYWASGFAYSSMRDTADGSYLNMYSARPATGANSSSTYCIGQQGSVLRLTGAAAGKALVGAYFTNGTYGTYSMENGDTFAKKFGGTTGDDPDWFKITVKAWYNGALSNDSVDIYLADYRFADNSADYILKGWQWVSLMSLGNADSLQFSLSSTDNGAYGMNTPPFFFMDDFTTADSPYGIKEISSNQAKVYPNPATEEINIEMNGQQGDCVIELIAIDGRLLRTISTNGNSLQTIDLSGEEDGIYFLRMTSAEGTSTSTFIKE